MLNRDIIAKDRVFLYTSCLTTHWLLLGLQGYVSTDATCPLLGDKKSLSLMDSKDKDNHLSTCCDTIVFFSFLQVKCPSPPPPAPCVVGGVMGNGDLVMLCWQRAIYLYLYVYYCRMGVISEILDPLQCRNDNQEVTFQIIPAKEGTRGPLEYSHQATSTSFGLVSSVVIWQSGIWARPCTSFAVLYDPSHSKMSQLISIWMKNSITYKLGR